MLKMLVPALVLFSAFSPAPDSPCPIQIEQVNPISYPFGNTDPWGWELCITYKNLSHADVVGIKFGANFLDATGDPERSYLNYESADRVKPGKSKKLHWSDGVYVHELGLGVGAEAWPIKISFADGTSWTDDGSHSCKVTAPQKVRK